MPRAGDPLGERDRRGPGRDAAALHPDIDLDERLDPPAGCFRRPLEQGDLDRVINADGDARKTREAEESRELLPADHLVGDDDVADAAPDERLGLADLLNALPHRAGALGLKPGDRGGFVGLRMGPEPRSGRREQGGHGVEVPLEGVEVEQQRRRVDLVFGHAGKRGRCLQHRRPL